MLTIRNASPTAIPQTRAPRNRALGIHQFQLHSTQGPTTLEKQVSATMNWFGNPKPFPEGNNHGTWGGSADFVVGPHLGQLRIYKFGDWFNTFSKWSAGYGLDASGRSEYGAAEVGIAIEIAQEALPGKPLGTYSEDLVDLVAQLMSYCNGVLVQQGMEAIPNNRISFWDQRKGSTIPRGIIGHEDLANGRRLGKQDPGRNFPWPLLQSRFQLYEDARVRSTVPVPEPGPTPVKTVVVPHATLAGLRDQLNSLLGE